MNLILTSREDATADYLAKRLDSSSVPYVRFDTDGDLSEVRVSYDQTGPTLRVRSEILLPSSISAVWFRRPKPLQPPANGDAAEKWQVAYEWSEALEGFLSHIPKEVWINHPTRNALASHKMEQLTRARRYGLRVPKTIVTQEPTRLHAFWDECGGHIVVKPLACGYIERASEGKDSVIFTNLVTEEDLRNAGSLAACPTLFQECIDKAADVRVTVLDESVTAIALTALDSGVQRLDIRRNNMADVSYSVVELPSQVASAVVAMIRSYGLRFAAIDLAEDKNGHWWFFEVNPNGQWAWTDLAGVSDIAANFIRAFSR